MQTSYKLKPLVSKQGVIVDDTLSRNGSYVTASDAKVGRAMSYVEPTRAMSYASGLPFLGVLINTPTITMDEDTGDQIALAKSPVSVREKGRIWVKVVSEATWGDSVYIVTSGNDAGLFSNSAGDLIPNAIFKSDTVDGLNILELN